MTNQNFGVGDTHSGRQTLHVKPGANRSRPPKKMQGKPHTKGPEGHEKRLRDMKVAGSNIVIHTQSGQTLTGKMVDFDKYTITIEMITDEAHPEITAAVTFYKHSVECFLLDTDK